MKRFTALMLLVVLVLSLFACKADNEQNNSSSTWTAHLTHEQCDEWEEKIADYLKNNNLYNDDYMSLKVSSGYYNNDTKENSKTKVYIILNGKLVDTYEECKTLSEGYYAAMTLYFGEKDIEKYDIEVRFAGKYTFINNILAETEK